MGKNRNANFSGNYQCSLFIVHQCTSTLHLWYPQYISLRVSVRREKNCGLREIGRIDGLGRKGQLFTAYIIHCDSQHSLF